MKFSMSLSIRARLVLLTTAAISLALSVVILATLWQETARYAQLRRDMIFNIGETIAASSARAVAENDVNSAYQAIRAISRITGIVFAGLIRADGQPIADVGATEQLSSDLAFSAPDDSVPRLALLRSKTVSAALNVIYGGAQVGQLRIVADTRDLPEILWQSIAHILWIGALSLIAAITFVLRLQKRITSPLQRLSDLMARVRRNHDYSLTLKADTRDEIATLVDSFNGMMSEIRARDAHLAQHRAQLEQDVADRTRDFQAAADDAMAANRAKSDFLATMSHEIRTPMNGILVMAELLAGNELPSRARRQAQVIARSGSSLLAIINDILDFSKIEAGKLDVETIEVDPEDAVATVLQLFSERARAKALDLSTHIDIPSGIKAIADPVRLGQVLSNLVNNALKFTDQGGVQVRVTHAPGSIRFSVLDTGTGIAPDKLETIFESFAQADQSTTRHYGGTGLGLTIARRLVDAMGGELTVESTVGQGSCFSFSVPAASETEMQQSDSNGAEPTLDALLLMPKTATREAVHALLTRASFSVSANITISQAKPRLIIGTPDLLKSCGVEPRAGMAIIAIAAAAETIDPAIDGMIDSVIDWPVQPRDVRAMLAAVRAGKDLRRDAGMSAQSEPIQFPGLRVLVADDSDVNREVADAALSRLGIRADFVTNGREAVSAILDKEFDLVLMDGSMPEMDGFQAARLIRNHENDRAKKPVPIVALTAHVVGSAANAWRTAGMDDVIYKPFTMAQLQSCLQKFCDGQKSVASAAPDGRTDVLTAQTPIIDTSVLHDLLDMAAGSRDVVQRIARLFADNAQKELSRLQAAAASSNFEDAGQASHALKSMSANIGARSLAHAASIAEGAARHDTPHLDASMIANISKLVVQTCSELEANLNNAA